MEDVLKRLQKLNTRKPNYPGSEWTRDPNRQFPKEEIQKDNKHGKKCSASLATRDKQIKAVLRLRATCGLWGMVIIKKRMATRACGDAEQRAHLCSAGGKCKFIVTVKNRVQVSQNLNDAAMCPSYVHFTMKDAAHKSQRTVPMFGPALGTIAKNWKQPRWPSADGG